MFGKDLGYIERGDLLLDKFHAALDPRQKLRPLVREVDHCDIAVRYRDVFKKNGEHAPGDRAISNHQDLILEYHDMDVPLLLGMLRYPFTLGRAMRDVRNVRSII